MRHSLKAWEGNKQNNELKCAYLNSQKEFTELVRRSKCKFRRERKLKLSEQQKYKPRSFWNFVKDIGSATQQLPTSVSTSSGEVVTEAKEVFSGWKDYFCFLLNPTNPEKVTTPSFVTPNLNASELNVSFSYEVVKAAILSSDNNKTPGYDQIKLLFIKTPLPVL